MLPAATIRALTAPAFTAAEFTPTQWDSAEDKAKFANALMKFIANEFPRQSFAELHKTALPAPEQHVRAHRSPQPGWLL
jgi:hypothetical protein